MLISRKHKKVVLNLANPSRVTTVIPTAKTFQFKGRTLVAVPHQPDEVKVLRNLGFDVPAPVLFHYGWPGMYDPFLAQEETTCFLTSHNRAFCLNDMGTGKTIATLWAYDYLRSELAVKRMMVVTPLSTLERTWGDEIFKHFPHLTFAVLHGSRERRLELLSEKFDVYLINHDGVKTIGLQEAMRDRKDINLIVVDEIAAFRNSSTDRWKALNTIANKQVPRKLWGLTGTPIPNAPTDAWAQCRLVVPESVPPYFGAFRDTVMRQISTYKWVPRDNALQTVLTAMQPAIRFKRDECVDLPPTIYENRHVDMTAEQKKAYKDMLVKLHTEYQGGQIMAVNEAVKASKLVQIACGVAYGSGGEEVILPSHPRIDVVKEIIEEAGAKVIVFVPFSAALDSVATALRKHWTVEVIEGGTSKTARDKIIKEFQQTKDPHVLVAQAGTMAHGLTLTAANTIVWFAPMYSNEIYEQANARIVRPSQKRTTCIIHIEGSEIERSIYERLRNKGSTQGLLLRLIKEANVK